MEMRGLVGSLRGAGPPWDQPGLTGVLEGVATGIGQRVADHCGSTGVPGYLVGVYHDPKDPTRACISPESLADVGTPLAGAAKLVIGVIWLLASLTTLIFVLVLFDV